MPEHAVKVEEQFGEVSTAYLSSEVHRTGADLETIAARVAAQPHARVLDLGCGAGHVSFAAALHANSVVAYDLSPQMLHTVADEAQRRGLANIRTVEGRAESLDFPDASFEFVLTRYSAHHWMDLPAALREARRVLKAGGGLIAVDTCAPAHPLFDTHLQTLELVRDTSHVRNYSVREWTAMLTAAGFAVHATTEWKLPLDFQTWITRMRTPAIYVDAIRSLLAQAPAEVREYFLVAQDSSFVIDAAMIEAR